MKKYMVCLFLSSVLMACQNNRKETGLGPIPKEEEINEPSTEDPKINCDSIWKAQAKIYAQKNDIILELIGKSEAVMPEENVKLLNALLEKNDAVLQFKQPLSAVFKGLEAEPFIISNSMWKKVDNGYIDYYPESYLLKQVDTLQSEPFVLESRTYFKNILKELPEEDRGIKVIGLKETSDALVTTLGMQHSECEPYAFYNFEYLNDDGLSTPLVASPYQLEIEYGNWPEIDALIEQNPVYKCSDCPHSYDKAKTFARLKGTTDVFFTFHGPEKEAEDSYTPNRSLLYVTTNREIIPLWADAIDLFGCSCL
jgi:hypothetical protein